MSSSRFWCIYGFSMSLGSPSVFGSFEVKSLSRVQLFVTPWTVAYQASPSTGFSRQEYWSGLPFLSPGELPDSGIEPGSPTLQADTFTSEPPGKPPGGSFTYVYFHSHVEMALSAYLHCHQPPTFPWNHCWCFCYPAPPCTAG